MKIAYLECHSGISGDMLLGAAVDAGLPVETLESGLRRLPVEGWKLTAKKVRRGALSATKLDFEVKESHHHRTWKTVRKLLKGSSLAPPVRETALKIFTRLAEAEASVHGVPADEVHFHEVGALDSILDIAGAAIALDALGIEKLVCSPLTVGSGAVETAHGTLPVPAPATAALLVEAPVRAGSVEAELVTPTGAAIVAACADEFGALPPMTLAAVGCGAGTREFNEQPNVLRLFVGETAGEPTGEQAAADDTVTVIEANLDDMSPQLAGHLMEEALAAGALDVFYTPVQMKKNRPGVLLTVLCEPGQLDSLCRMIFEQATTIGLRTYTAQRRTLKRELVTVDTPHGQVRMKLARMNGRVLNAAPEYEDCRKLAREKSVPLKQVMADAEFAYRKGRGD